MYKDTDSIWQYVVTYGICDKCTNPWSSCHCTQVTWIPKIKGWRRGKNPEGYWTTKR